MKQVAFAAYINATCFSESVPGALMAIDADHLKMKDYGHPYASVSILTAIHTIQTASS